MPTPFAQGIYQILNPEKYVGTALPRYRSSWELAFMRKCDSHPGIIQWASECIQIPYQHPLTGRPTVYIPDFLIKYQDQTGKMHVELVEIKPSSQSTLEAANSAVNRAHVHVNAAKWAAAVEWCAAKGIRFRVITENEIFDTRDARQSRRNKPRTKRKR